VSVSKNGLSRSDFLSFDNPVAGGEGAKKGRGIGGKVPVLWWILCDFQTRAYGDIVDSGS
jgi:hypothetical protein